MVNIKDNLFRFSRNERFSQNVRMRVKRQLRAMSRWTCGTVVARRRPIHHFDST